ncbi:hypothetical protein M5K25_009016 [Dendrobium thyrsiflorum]|uniref:Reverse transcriptase zinc-binding domain-containing protein n=1 Tax=Dendrobium thyrsiflorum TaxID=117978 RepID=A0ABD0V572_DENTH
MTITAIVYRQQFEQRQDPVVNLSQLRLHPREKFFWWRIFGGILPTHEWLSSRHLPPPNPACPWGCSEPEDINHVTSECSFLLDILSALSNWGFFVPRFRSFAEVKLAIATVRKKKGAGLQLYCYAVYQAWRSRNAKKHGRPFGSPTVLAAAILATCKSHSFSSSPEHWGTIQPSWLSSPNSWYPPLWAG